MKFNPNLNKIKSAFLRISNYLKKRPFVIFVFLIFFALLWAGYIFYEKAYRINNLSPHPQANIPRINESTFLEIQKLIEQRQANINENSQKSFNDPFR